MDSPLAVFGADARAWFEERFGTPTPVQRDGWARIAAGEHALLLAPTGSGKTLAAFLYWIDRLARSGAGAGPGVRVLYVSPQKALVYDIERNLQAPLAGIEQAIRTREVAGQSGVPLVLPRVAVRTGDTPQSERRAQARNPAEILVTTPESLYLILGSAQHETLRTLECVIVDEIHALVPGKRGAHLALSLERVAALCGRDPQRIGLSATARPVDEVARFLGGDRPVSLVDASGRPQLDLRISVPVPDLTRPGETPGPVTPPPGDGERAAPPVPSIWPAVYPQILAAIRAHQSTIVFTNSRGLCERLAQRLNELAGEPLVRAHHGSLAHEKRREIEEALKSGQLAGIVATSSLELGIDMDAVDLVMLVESPGSAARGLQRVGRAGHGVGQVSRGTILPKHRGDLLEATVVAERMRAGAVEEIRLPRNPLDVLAQQLVAWSGQQTLSVDGVLASVRRCASYRELSRDQLEGVLDMLAGRYPSTDFAELQPRIVWNRERDSFEARRGALALALMSGGTIPDRGLYAVHHGSEGPRIGELDEEMVHETRPGDVITLGASTWRVTETTRDRVTVSPAPGEVGRLPFWRGEGPGRPLELGRAQGRFVRELAERCHGPAGPDARRAEGEAWLRDAYGLDTWAARNLVDYVVGQREAAGCLPSDRAITIERFRDELGDWRVCILSPFGARLHAPWALAIESRLSREAGFQVQTLWNDDGIVLRFADADAVPGREALLPGSEEVEDCVVAQLGGSALFAGLFRENAARALLLPRRRPGARTPLWTQRLRAQNLLAVAREFPAFPMMLETYRSCLQDVFDLPGLIELLRAVERRDVRVDEVETRSPSPFARSLVFAYTATYLYQGDTPVAERRAQALTLDRHMLRDLLGQEELRDLLDAEVIEQTEAELQGRAPERRARHADALHDLLRRVGDLTPPELVERCDGPADSWLEQLEAEGRVARVEVAGSGRVVAAEEVALYRDALGVAVPAGVPEALLAPVERPLEQLLVRFARRRGPFLTRDAARRYALPPAQLTPLLAQLETRGDLLAGDFHPHGVEREWCHPDVLRRLRRETLARLRNEVAPVEGAVFARFLPAWQGVGQRASEAQLDEVLAQLEGVPLAFSELEGAILPARIPDFEPRMLDERGALGQWVWVGCGALGERDGRIALYRRERVALLAEASELPDDLGELAHAIHARLAETGACFFAELAGHSGAGQRELSAALLELAWAGLVTNDTFAPLRGLASPLPRARRRRSGLAPAAGRWSRVAPLLQPEPTPTERAHARAQLLLERYGVLSRDALAIEAIPGGFAAVYPVLRAMEEAGKLRRGLFVDGLAGAQFAFAGPVDRLRAARAPGRAPEVTLLAACDPASPFGALLPWPACTSDAGRPRRAAGCRVVCVDGAPVWFAERGAKRLFSFRAEDPDRAGADRRRGVRALSRLFAQRQRSLVRVEEIDGVAALHSPHAADFQAAGFRAGYKGLELERHAALLRDT